jgi:hypothetical protein
MSNFKKIEVKSKPTNLKRGKDEMTSFIEAEFSKFKKVKNENPVAVSNSTQIKGDNNPNMIISINANLNSEAAYAKFPSFKMPDKTGENTMLNVSGSDFLKSSGAGTRLKTPFVMKKFENMENTKEKFITKEIIDDLEKNKNVNNLYNFVLKIEKNPF